MPIIFGSLAVLGLLAALGVHVLALLGLPVEMAQVWWLHVGVFIGFIPAIFYLKRQTESNDPLALFRGLPSWAVVALLVLFLYAFLNFFAALSATGGGSPDIRDGQYVLINKGRLVRKLSAAEYAEAHAAEVRLFSGHWLLFYAIPATVFFRRNRREA